MGKNARISAKVKKHPLFLNKADRAKLMAKKIHPVDVKDLFEKGLSIWQVTEEYFERKFDHADRRTWIFYQKINNSRKAQNLGRNVVHLTPLTANVIQQFLADHSADELIERLKA